jgi:hypothetical protein
MSNDTAQEKRFPKPTLTKIVSKPSHQTLSALEQELNSNAISVKSTLGGGAQPWTSHPHNLRRQVPYSHRNSFRSHGASRRRAGPWRGPFCSQDGGDESNLRQTPQSLKEVAIYTSLEASLKRQLLEAIRPIDNDALNDNLYGFALLSTFDILQHLRQTHGKITPDDLRKNLLELDRKWQPPEEIGSLFKQIKDCRQLASDGDNPITEKTAVRSALQNIETTDLFSYACSKWREKDEPDQTLDIFASHFTDADTERQRKATSASAG